MKIICLMSDTFRYDYIGYLKIRDIKTPEIDDLIEDSVFFRNYYVSSFPTIPCREDIFCGYYSFLYHGWQPLEKEALPMAQIFQNEGYVSQLITDTPHLMGRGYNYSKGFTGYYWIRGQESDIPLTRCNYEIKKVLPPEKTRMDPIYLKHNLSDISRWVNAEWRSEEDRFMTQTAKLASKWIEENYKLDNFLLWVDFFDPHEPWDPPEYLVKTYDPNYSGVPMTHPNYKSAQLYTKEELRNLQAHYAAEVTLVSKWIGYLIRKIKDVGIYEDSVIIFTSDHGIYLGEHDRTGKHAVKDSDISGPWPLYQEITHIPLVFYAPKVKAKICNELVQPPDLFPTLLDIAGIKKPKEIQGYSVAPLLTGRYNNWPRKYAFSSSSTLKDQPWITVTTQNRTFLTKVGKDKSPQLYNIINDPNEQNNLYGENLKIENEIREGLIKFLKSKNINYEELKL